MMTNQDRSHAGKVTFVTGPTSGIGRATALAFAHEGASVAVGDIAEQDSQATARIIETDGAQALAVRCEVTRAENVKAALDGMVDAFGRLDFAFNNTGVEQLVTAAADVTEAE